MFAPVVAGEFLISLLATVMLLALDRRDPGPALRLWAVAFLMQSVTTALVGHRLLGPERVGLMTLAALSGLACAVFFVWGTLRYLGRTLRRAWLAVPAAILLFQVPGVLWGWPLPVRAAPVVLVMGGSVILVGAVLLRGWSRSIGARLTGLGFVAYGVHVFDFPVADAFPAWLTWGHMLAGFLQAVICTGLVLLHFEKATDTLAEEKRRYQALFENAIVGIFRADASGTIVSANRTLRRRVAGEGSLVGRPLRALFVEPGAADALFLGDGPELAVHALQWRTDAGEVVDVQLYVQRAADAGVEGVVVDVTRRATLERHLDQVQRAEVLGQLAGGIAHDLNNVLTVVMGNTQQLRERTNGADGVADLVDAITTATDQGAALTRQLLTFARSHPTTEETFELGPRVEQAVRMVQATLEEGIALELDIASTGCLVSADAGLLEQVVVNLVLNARDAMPDGGRLGVSVRGDGAVVLLEVQDSGVGMDDATRSRIFEPFYSTKTEGTGLGLAVAQRVVRQAGGHIEVESAAGKGTTLRVRLPGAVAAAGEAPAQATPGSATARLLLVEDRPNVRAIMALQLKHAGYEVVAPETSAEAVQQLDGGLAVDLLVTDVRMPPPTGPEVAQAFRARHPGAPVLFVSGFSDEAGLPGALEGPNTRFLAKPFTEAQLLTALQELLAGRTPLVARSSATPG